MGRETLRYLGMDIDAYMDRDERFERVNEHSIAVTVWMV